MLQSQTELHKMKPTKITYHWLRRNNSLLRQRKNTVYGIHEYEKLYHAEMYLFRHFLSDNLCHPLFSPMEQRRILQGNKLKTHATVIEMCDFFSDVHVTFTSDHGVIYQLPRVWKLRSKLSYCRQYGTKVSYKTNT